MNNSDKNILREYVRISLNEESEEKSGGIKRGDVGGAFKNLWNTIVGSIKVVASRTKTLLKLTKELVVTTLLKPWEKAEYEKIMSHGEAEYQLIKKKYPDQSLWEHIHEDMKIALFFLYPAPFVAKHALQYGKDAVKGTYKALTDPADMDDKAKKHAFKNPRFQYGRNFREERYESYSEGKNVVTMSKRRSQRENLIVSKFGSALLIEEKDKKKEEKPSKEKIAKLSKDLNKVIKSVAKQRAPGLEKLVQKMKESGESDKKAIRNLEKQIKILRSL